MIKNIKIRLFHCKAAAWAVVLLVSLSYPGPFLYLGDTRICCHHDRADDPFVSPSRATMVGWLRSLPLPGSQTSYCGLLQTRASSCGSDQRWDQLWHYTTCAFWGHSNFVSDMIISSDGLFALSGCGEGSFCFWDLTKVWSSPLTTSRLILASNIKPSSSEMLWRCANT